MVKYIFVVLVVLANFLLFCSPLNTSADPAGNSPLVRSVNNIAASGYSPPGFCAADEQSSLVLNIESAYGSYFTDEPITLTADTNTVGTSATLYLQPEGGQEQSIVDFQTSRSYSHKWTTPSKPGNYTITLKGSASVMVWTECVDVRCPFRGDCDFYTYACQKAQDVTNRASCQIRVLDRAVSISGYVNDLNEVPIRGATVKLEGSGQYATTDFAGFYKISPYKIGNKYIRDDGGQPMVSEKIGFDAMACQLAGKQFDIHAEKDITDLNATLQRIFCPAAIKLDDFTYEMLSGWGPAKDYITWQNVVGITTDSGVAISKIEYAGTGFLPLGLEDVPYKTFTINDKELTLVESPALGRYFLEMKGRVNEPYTVQVAGTLEDKLLENVVLESKILMGDTEQISLVINNKQFVLERGTGFPLIYMITGLIALLALTAIALLVVLKKSPPLARAYGGVVSFIRAVIKPGKSSTDTGPAVAAQPVAAPAAADGADTAATLPADTRESAETKVIRPKKIRRPKNKGGLKT
jgi:hypothetical protein